MTHQVALDIAQTSTIAFAVIIVAVIAVAGLVGIGMYRARYAAAREEGYRTLAERSADSTQATAEELKGVRAELGEVRQRLAALEKLLSQIG
jgi:5-bromo-4-chloroindolyl phosphate hydrolysis protein